MPFVSGAATAIGSFPGYDPRRVVDLVIQHHPDLPALPQLPGRSPMEGMVAAAAAGLSGVTVRPDGTLAVDARRLRAPEQERLPFVPGSLVALEPFLAAVAGRRRPVKVQLTGPVTLGLALVHAGVPPVRAFPVAAAAVRARGRALVAAVRASAPEAPIAAFLDEPSLVAAVKPGFPLSREPVIDLLSTALAALTPAVTGVHCCGPTDWGLAVEAGARVLSLPLEPEVVEDAHLFATFLERGGWIAWGAVPTNGPLGTRPDPLWRRLLGIWCDLTGAGVDPSMLRRQALVTPACGLAHHGHSQAELVLRLAGEIGARVRDQAVAARLSVGA